MDLLVNPTESNSARLFAVLNKLGMTGVSPDSFTKPGVHAPLKGEFYADLLTPKEGGLTFYEVSATAAPCALFYMPVHVASPASLITMKRQAISDEGADLEKHLHDIDLLERL
jgi:hypothetical protein